MYMPAPQVSIDSVTAIISALRLYKVNDGPSEFSIAGRS
jgi:hypothetical protein